MKIKLQTFIFLNIGAWLVVLVDHAFVLTASYFSFMIIIAAVFTKFERKEPDKQLTAEIAKLQALVRAYEMELDNTEEP